MTERTAVKVGINGFGRIGRQVFRIAHNNPAIEIVAINDLGSAEQMAFLLQHDSNYRAFDAEVTTNGKNIVVDGREIAVFTERDPAKLEWAKYGADIVIESTGVFRDRAKAALHMTGGAKKVLISAPGKNSDCTIVMGVNEEVYCAAEHDIISNASCTTNCLAPVVKVIDDQFGLVRGFMTTVHSYTNDQNILDGPHKDFRRARAAAVSIIPTSTGAAQAIGDVLPQLKAMRVPTPTGSLVDLTIEVAKDVTAEELNAAFEAAAAGHMKGFLGVSYEPLVSVDYIGDSRSSIVDALSTKVIGGKLVKVLSWYDNEWGYSSRMVDLAIYVGSKGL